MQTNDLYGVKRIIKPNEEQAKELEKVKSTFRACFSTQAGQEVLGFIKKKYLSKPVCVIDNVYYGYIREGQNNVVRELVDLSKDK